MLLMLICCGGAANVDADDDVAMMAMMATMMSIVRLSCAPLSFILTRISAAWHGCMQHGQNKKNNKSQHSLTRAPPDSTLSGGLALDHCPQIRHTQCVAPKNPRPRTENASSRSHE